MVLRLGLVGMVGAKVIRHHAYKNPHKYRSTMECVCVCVCINSVWYSQISICGTKMPGCYCLVLLYRGQLALHMNRCVSDHCCYLPMIGYSSRKCPPHSDLFIWTVDLCRDGENLVLFCTQRQAYSLFMKLMHCFCCFISLFCSRIPLSPLPCLPLDVALNFLRQRLSVLK